MSMVAMLSASVVVLFFLILAEKLHRTNRAADETARKLIHITVGMFVATWPFYLSAEIILILSAMLLVGIIVSRHFNIFNSIHSVRRQTWGDVLFPVGIGITALLASAPWIFAVAILHVGLADGLAAIAGQKYKKARQYKVFGQSKTATGTLVFFAVSVVIMSAAILLVPGELSHRALPLLIAVPLVATLIENVAPNGSDNVFVPIVLCVMLGLLAG